MPPVLDRLLRLRALLEESSRVELELRTALAARIDRAQQRERETERASRGLAIEVICDQGSAPEQSEGRTQTRTLEWINAEIAAWRGRQLEPIAAATARRVAEGRAAFFERRMERQQVESILDAARAREQAEEERRTQRDLDDWFSMKLFKDHSRK
jgi:hypothetical protein